MYVQWITKKKNIQSDIEMLNDIKIYVILKILI